MQFNKTSEPKKSEPTNDPHLIASWGSIAGALLGIIITLFAGYWLSNALMLGAAGFIVGALIDRSRK